MSKTNFKKIVVVFILLVTILSLSFLAFNTNIARAEAGFDLADYTDSDNFINDPNNNIHDYAKSMNRGALTDSYGNSGDYASTIKYSMSTDKMNRLYANGDDPIIQIIPKSLFTQSTNEMVHIGLEYGFFIKTEQLQDGVILANVYLFDFENPDLLEKDNARFNIKALFQKEFVYFSKKVDSIKTRQMIPGDETKVVQNLNRDISVDIEKTNIVVPLPYCINLESYGFADSDRFYMTDIVNTVSVYNEQHLNEGEEGYNAVEDKGRFIVRQDSAYSAKILDVADNAVEEAMSIILKTTLKTFADMAIGIILPGLSETLEAIKLLRDVSAPFYDEIHNVGKEFYYEPSYVTAQGQIEETGHLSRTAVSTLEMVNNGEYGEGSFMFYDIGDSFATDYQLAYTPVSNENGDGFETAWEARLKRGYMMNFRSATNTNDVVSAGDIHNVTIRDEEEREKRDLEDTHKVHILPGGDNLFEFIPEHSGIYNLKTANADSEVLLDQLETDSKLDKSADVINKSMTLNLKAGETYNFSTKFKDENKSGKYDLIMEYIPYDLPINGNEISFDLNILNDYSLIEIDLFRDGGYNFEMAVEGRVLIELFDAYNINGKPIFSTTLNSSGVSKLSLAQFLLSKNYLFKIKNLENDKSTFTINAKCAETVVLNYPYKSIESNEWFYAYMPDKDCRITIESNDADVQFELYSESGNKLDMYHSTNLNSRNLNGGETYYVKMLRLNDRLPNFLFNISLDKLNLGNNAVVKGSIVQERVLSICFDNTDVVINISSDNAIIKVVDENDLELPQNNLLLKEGEKYYIYVTIVNADKCNINVEVESESAGAYYLEEINGQIGTNSFNFIKYDAANAGSYSHEIGNGLTYEIYNEHLVKLNANLILDFGSTYYMKVYGAINQEYRITFAYASQKVVNSDFNVVKNGFYAFDVPQIGNYIFKSYDCTYKIDILGINGYILHHDILISDNNLDIYIERTKLIIIVKELSGNDYLSIKNENSLVDNSNIELSANSTNFSLGIEEAMMLTFTPKINAVYYLEFGAKISSKVVSVFYCDNNGKIINVESTVIEDGKIFEIELFSGLNYYFRFDNYTSNSILDNNYKLYLPTFIDNIYIDGDIVVEDSTIIKNNLILLLGFSYSFQIEYKWQPTVSDLKITPTDGLAIEGNQILIDINAKLGDSHALSFSTIANDINLAIKIESPYTVDASLTGNDLTVTINYHDKLNASLYNKPEINCIVVGTSFALTFDDFINDNNVYKYSFKEDSNLYAQNYDVEVTINIEFESFELIVVANNMQLETEQIASGTSDKTRVYVNGEGESVTLESNVETLIIAKNSRLSSIIIAQSSKDIVIAISDTTFAFGSVTNGIESNRNTTIFNIEGIVKLNGKAIESVIKAENIVFKGSGTLNINGAHGADALDEIGANGKQGTNGITANTILIDKDSELNFNVTAGNGGNGSNGITGERGQCGTKGGDGGNGGQAVTYDIINESISTIILLTFGSGGNGGNGGNGGIGKDGTSALLQGGNGGKGGACGIGGLAGEIPYGLSNAIAGNQGEDGFFGDGGKGGKGANGTPVGGRGGDGGAAGGDGAKMGDGGNGGNGAKSTNAGGRGGDGYNGGNGGNGSGVSSPGTGGRGGDGGTAFGEGGIGGKGGDGGNSGPWSAAKGGKGGNGGDSINGKGGDGGKGGSTDLLWNGGGKGGDGGDGKTGGGKGGKGGKSTTGGTGSSGKNGELL